MLLVRDGNALGLLRRQGVGRLSPPWVEVEAELLRIELGALLGQGARIIHDVLEVPRLAFGGRLHHDDAVHGDSRE